MIREACITDAWHRANLFKQASVESTPTRFVVSKRVDINARGNGIARIEPRINRSRVKETSQAETRTDHQDDARSHLRDDQRIAKSRPRRSSVHGC